MQITVHEDFKKLLNRLIFLFFILHLLVLPEIISAHPVSVVDPAQVTTKAEVYIDQGRIRLILEIDKKDSRGFARLLATRQSAAEGNTAGAEDSPQSESLQDFQFLVEDDKPLAAKLITLESRLRLQSVAELKGTPATPPEADLGLFGPPEFTEIFYAELEYELAGQPRRLTIIPPTLENLPVNDVLSEDEVENANANANANADIGALKTRIGFIAYHNNQLINDFNYLSGKEILALDWEDPWYSHFVDSELVRHDAIPLASYLHIGPMQIRHYVIVRLKDLGAMLTPDLNAQPLIEADEWETIKQQAGSFLLTKNPLSADGTLLQPELDQVQFVEFDKTGGVRLLPEPQRLDMTQATVGVALRYPITTLPDQITLEWQLFSEKMNTVPVAVYNPNGESSYHTLTLENNQLTWEKSQLSNTPVSTEILPSDFVTHYQVPLASVVCLLLLIPVAWWLSIRYRDDQPIHLQLLMAGLLLWAGGALAPYWHIPIPKPPGLAPTLSEQAATGLLENLLNNVYQAFNAEQENAIQKELSRSVAQTALAKTYQQIRRSLQNSDSGVNKVKVAAIELGDVTVKPATGDAPGFRFDARWKVSMAGGQWDRAQICKNLLNAVIEIETIDGFWQITEFDILDQRSIDEEVSGS